MRIRYKLVPPIFLPDVGCLSRCASLWIWSILKKCTSFSPQHAQQPPYPAITSRLIWASCAFLRARSRSGAVSSRSNRSRLMRSKWQALLQVRARKLWHLCIKNGLLQISQASSIFGCNAALRQRNVQKRGSFLVLGHSQNCLPQCSHEYSSRLRLAIPAHFIEQVRWVVLSRRALNGSKQTGQIFSTAYLYRDILLSAMTLVSTPQVEFGKARSTVDAVARAVFILPQTI